jgi:hypothetical protein
MFPKLKIKLRGLHFAYVAEIQDAVTEELKRNCTTAQKPVYMQMELILSLKNVMCHRFKKISYKLLEHTVYVVRTINVVLILWRGNMPATYVNTDSAINQI